MCVPATNSSSRRAVFAQPWQGGILMGTTERPYRGAPEAVAPTAAEIEYLLGIYNHYFRRGLGPGDVLSSFAGLRVLPATPESPFARTRETILQEDDPEDPRLFTIYGGKLTSHHATAERLLSRISPLLHDGSRHS
jgi:glycerol-3-phosphate dehydrogenase